MVGFMESTYDVEISFLGWMIMGVPFSVLMISIIYIVLVKMIYPNGLGAKNDSKEIIDEELRQLGPIQKTEKRVLIIFFVTMILWVGRVFINKYVSFIHLSDAGISMMAAFALFTIPFNLNTGEYTLDWKDTQKLPWGILILFGGGLALASGMSGAGVIEFIGKLISENKALSALIIGSLLIAIMLFMTELMSNVALVAIFAPVVAGIAIGLDKEILYLLIPVAMASSCAFMLPMSTPPNAIVFASGHIKVHEMARAGFILNILSILILIVFATYIIPHVF